MARARSFKPAFFKNEALAALPFGCRLLFVGLWTLADRAGRLEDRPKRIAAEIFPFDRTAPVEKWLTTLAAGNDPFIIRYSAGENRYIAVPKWNKHQNPHVKEAPSTIPAPGEHSAGTVRAREIPERALLTPDSLNLTPLTRNPVRASDRGVTDDIEDWVRAVCDRHPNSNSRILGEQALVALAVDPSFDREAFDRVHEAWCRTVRWTKEENRYAPQLAKWIGDKGYRRMPATSQNGTKKGAPVGHALVVTTEDACGWMPE